MDPTIVDLTTKVIAVLSPFVSKGVEEFAMKVGDAAYEKAKALLTTLKQKWAGDKEAIENLNRFEEKPERYKTVLEDILQEKLSQDKDLVSTLSRLLQDLGPGLEVIQFMDEGRDVTGLKAKQMRSGTAKVTQDMETGEKVVGAEFETFG